MAQSHKRTSERVIEGVLFSSAFITILVTLSIIFILLSGAFSFFSEISIIDFITDSEWTPTFAEKHYGILPLLSGTLLTTIISVLIAVPMGVTIAIYLIYINRVTHLVIKALFFSNIFQILEFDNILNINIAYGYIYKIITRLKWVTL